MIVQLMTGETNHSWGRWVDENYMMTQWKQVGLGREGIWLLHIWELIPLNISMPMILLESLSTPLHVI